jgi:outer membrane protein OmpA-like peptidoglycan-associated protein
VRFFRRYEYARPERTRRWWVLGLAVPVAVALAVAIVVMPQASGHSSFPAANEHPAANQHHVANQHPVAHSSRAPAPAADQASHVAVSKTTATTHPAAAAPAAAQSSPSAASKPTPTTLAPDWYLQPDGSALPLLVVFDGSTIYLTGAVPSTAIGQYLSGLAEAYSKTPHARLVTKLVVDPRVPPSTGVRVIEMNAVRFASGSTQITPDYAPELSRVVTILKAMPKLTALVIGHADQTGASAQNVSISVGRATSVVEYLVSRGINPDRLSAQGIGDTSLLTRQSNAAGLALNRRTEFVFYGLMAGS